MSPIDEQLEMAEVDARPHTNGAGKEEGLERPSSSGTTGSTGYSSSLEYNPQLHTLHSRNTELDLERHRTATSHALSRIETQRLQHQLTVGESVKSRASRTPLPRMGANKDYPPPLPDREDYVVEFDGPEDPLYPQNWELGTKYAFPNLVAHERHVGRLNTDLCSRLGFTLAPSSPSPVSAVPSIPLSLVPLPPTLRGCSV